MNAPVPPTNAKAELLARTVEHAAQPFKEFLKKLVSSGFEPLLGYGPDRSNQYLRDEFAKWHPVVQKVQGPG